MTSTEELHYHASFPSSVKSPRLHPFPQGCTPGLGLWFPCRRTCSLIAETGHEPAAPPPQAVLCVQAAGGKGQSAGLGSGCCLPPCCTEPAALPSKGVAAAAAPAGLASESSACTWAPPDRYAGTERGWGTEPLSGACLRLPAPPFAQKPQCQSGAHRLPCPRS